jgi:hypothetical protein
MDFGGTKVIYQSYAGNHISLINSNGVNDGRDVSQT